MGITLIKRTLVTWRVVRTDARIHLDFPYHLLKPWGICLEQLWKSSLDQTIRSHKPVTPHSNASFDIVSDIKGIVQCYPAKSPPREQKSLWKSRQSKDRHWSRKGSHRNERRVPCLWSYKNRKQLAFFALNWRGDDKRFAELTMCPYISSEIMGILCFSAIEMISIKCSRL